MALDDADGLRATDSALERLRIERSSTAERVADGLRELIICGDVKPGSPLRESEMVQGLDVSRNTIREAFRMLGRDGLVTHQMHRGVVVKELTERDVKDIYATRSMLELAAIARAGQAEDTQLQPIAQVAQNAEAEAADANWKRVATCDLLLHQHVVELLGSERVNVFFRGILAELRLAFAVVDDQKELLFPFVSWNQKLSKLLLARDVDACAAEMSRYLATAEETILAALEHAHQPGTPTPRP